MKHIFMILFLRHYYFHILEEAVHASYTVKILEGIAWVIPPRPNPRVLILTYLPSPWFLLGLEEIHRLVEHH